MTLSVGLAPDVTVVIGAYNAMPYLIECVNSVLAQTIRRDRVEIVAVDDGSTDGSGELLDWYARLDPRIRVVHQPNSGTPAGPRNVGIALAGGRYLLFLDADDYLGVEALQRLVAVADKNGSDMVIGRIVGVNRSDAPVALYTHNQPKADLYTSKVYTTLRSQRLFSRSLIDRVGLRFPELLIAQDQAFAAVASIHAKVISVVADYDCYYLRLRDDGQNITRRVRDILVRVSESEYIMALVAEHVPPGEKRDFLMRRHFRDLARWCYAKLYLASPPQTQLEVVRRSQALLAQYYTPDVAAALPAAARIRFELVRQDRGTELIDIIRCDVGTACPPELIEDGRVFARYPGFRERPAQLPDALFDITGQVKVHHSLARLRWRGSRLALRGHAYIEHVDVSTPADAPATELVLRRRSDGRDVRLPVTAAPLKETASDGRHDYALAGFTVTVDVAGLLRSGQLEPGLWDAFLDVGAQGIRREVRFGRHRARPVEAGVKTAVVRGAEAAVAVRPYFTNPYDNLTLDIGADIESWRPDLTVSQVAWARGVPATLVVAGRVDLTRLSIRGKPTIHLSLAALPSAEVRHTVAARLDPDTGQFVVAAPLRQAADGRSLGHGHYAAELVLDVAGIRCQWALPPTELATVRWLRGGWPSYAVSTPGSGLTISVTGLTRPRLVGGVRRRMERRARRRRARRAAQGR